MTPPAGSTPTQATPAGTALEAAQTVVQHGLQQLTAPDPDDILNAIAELLRHRDNIRPAYVDIYLSEAGWSACVLRGLLNPDNHRFTRQQWAGFRVPRLDSDELAATAIINGQSIYLGRTWIPAREHRLNAAETAVYRELRSHGYGMGDAGQLAAAIATPQPSLAGTTPPAAAG